MVSCDFSQFESSFFLLTNFLIEIIIFQVIYIKFEQIE